MINMRLFRSLFTPLGGVLLLIACGTGFVLLNTNPASAASRGFAQQQTPMAPQQAAATGTSTPTLQPTSPPTITPTPTPTIPPPQIAGCDIFPADNIWNTPINTAPLDPNSAAYINTIGANRTLHPDFGSGLWEGGPIGIPFITVAGTQSKVAVSFDYADESDPGPYPVPTDAPIEGGPDADGDRHVIMLDQEHCQLYELYNSYPQEDGSWTAGSGAIFDLNSHTLRPDGWTSADAAGLPLLPGLVRYDEVASGEIRHALRFTVPQTQRAYVWPARHYASSLTEAAYPPMGQRFRLRTDFPLASFAPPVKVILRAMQTYGIILADNGSPWYISGVPDERWDNDVLQQLGRVKGSDFEAVDVRGLVLHVDSGQVRPQVIIPQDHFLYLPIAKRPSTLVR